MHPHDIAECEDMLEVYFMQLDFLFGRLTMLEEAVEDTEDLIEVDLDHRCVAGPSYPDAKQPMMPTIVAPLRRHCAHAVRWQHWLTCR